MATKNNYCSGDHRKYTILVGMRRVQCLKCRRVYAGDPCEFEDSDDTMNAPNAIQIEREQEALEEDEQDEPDQYDEPEPEEVYEPSEEDGYSDDVITTALRRGEERFREEEARELLRTRRRYAPAPIQDSEGR